MKPEAMTDEEINRMLSGLSEPATLHAAIRWAESQTARRWEAELRRLSAVNAELLEALKEAWDVLPEKDCPDNTCRGCQLDIREATGILSAAIARGEQT